MTEHSHHYDELISQNLWEFSKCLGTLGEVYEGADVKWARVGPWRLNRAMAARFSNDEADARISEVANSFRKNNTGLIWITSPADQPRDIEERLPRLGFSHLFPWVGMAADMCDLPSQLDAPAGMKIAEVSDADALQTWAETAVRGFGWTGVDPDKLCAFFSAVGCGGTNLLRHYLGFLDGAPAGTCTILNGTNSLGVYIVATVPEARRKGVGRAMTLYPLLQLREDTHPTVVLQASPMGRPVYERLGFREYSPMNLWALEPPA